MSAIVALIVRNWMVIGISSLILRVPLVFTIVVVNFIGGYITYIGAFLGGGLAVLVALGHGTNQALWVAELRHNGDDPALLLAAFEAIRRANLDLWARRPVSDRQRVGRHRERGPASYDLTFRLAAGHDRIHLAQARRALDEARAPS